MIDKIRKENRKILKAWLESCRRNGRISRNTVAIGIVVLDHLRQGVVSRKEVVSQGGEVSGARSGLPKTLGIYGIPEKYLKEITTRQAHQDGQKLFEQLGWGSNFASLSNSQRDSLILELIAVLKNLANDWLKRESLKFNINRSQAPSTWINIIVETATGHSGGIVEQQLVGAKLERRFKGTTIDNYPAHAADRQTDRLGDFKINKLVYHVTGSPSRGVVQKCKENLAAGLHPLLLIPRQQESKARFLAQEEGIDRELTVVSIEDFVAMNIIELATEENTDFFSVLKEIVEIYNRRLSEVETDLSLHIKVQ